MRRIAKSMCAATLVLVLSAVAINWNAPSAYAQDSSSSRSYIPLAIIGNDDRVKVSDTFEYPYSAIAFMKVHARCGCNWEGSGFMVLPDILLTAGHCICCTEHQEPADRIELLFGYQPDGSYAYKYDGKWESYPGTTFPGGYTDQNMEQDYGILHLAEDVGNTTGYFGMKVKSDADFKSSVLRAAGYRDGLLKYDNGKVEVASSQSVRFYADTLPGNSGCPVYDGEIASAICVAHSELNDYNVGHRITQDLFDRVFKMTTSDVVPDDPGDGAGDATVVDPDKTGRDGYVLADSAKHLYSREELSSLSDWGLAVARNEIPARHGYIFEGGDFSKYFNSKSWYKGTLTREQFQSKVGILNYIEEANVQTILGMEVLRGSQYVPDSSQVISPSLTGPNGYVLPKSDTHRYTKAELGALTDWGLAVARNEINARHGYIFENSKFADYFRSKSWYKGTLTGDEFRSIAGILNETEEANVATILEMEKEMGSQYLPGGGGAGGGSGTGPGGGSENLTNRTATGMWFLPAQNGDRDYGSIKKAYFSGDQLVFIGGGATLGWGQGDGVMMEDQEGANSSFTVTGSTVYHSGGSTISKSDCAKILESGRSLDWIQIDVEDGYVTAVHL